jgi:fructose-bisphosphate aldolase, class I
MDMGEMKKTTRALMRGGKGILAMDESTATCTKNFKNVGLESTPKSREEYREMLVTSPGLGKYISGAILFDETIRQSPKGKPFPEILKNQNIIPGIKVDLGTKPIPGSKEEKLTFGIEGLSGRLKEYKSLKAKFAKWRAVITIDGKKGLPSEDCIEKNSEALAQYASICQKEGIVPIVEPEVIMDGAHTIDESYKTTEKVLQSLFKHLKKKKVSLPETILKPNMVLSGYSCPEQAGTKDIAKKTLDCLIKNVPKEVGGIAFLSGGQSDEEATRNLDEIVKLTKKKAPWPITFSYGRGLQREALAIWAKTRDIKKSQQIVIKKAKENSEAAKGKFNT